MAWFITGLRHEAIRLAKKQKRLRERELLILNDLFSQDAEDEETERLDTVAAICDTLTAVEDSLFLQEALSLLTPQQQKVIKATILEGHTEQEVAAELGMSQPAVHQMKERALKKLRKHFVLDEPTAK
ncbi:sigma-70 family RNA polymerase sigma factor [Desulfofundulus thermocisternus]|jgi:RNA polymerase sigma factor (sigma-70 family)|uniref:sigma-70 family RNA polymerase sigma factor n=1 Tax=Desulfofundulus thermocisternus TaxID=42471 RepID=UPI00068CA4EB|nr:sigma-70 family RNA polymerase sigma factor [Desulfofundulus thermocisternus]